MQFLPTDIDGAFVVEPQRHTDERGWFARVFEPEAFAAQGIAFGVTHVNASFNALAGTLRGLHLQTEPYAEAKLVRCARGAVWDVVADVRRDSPTYLRWTGVELDAEGGRAVYAPPGVAHGFVTLADESELLYLMSAPYVAEAARGVRWDDPALGIAWPREPVVISERDRRWPDLGL